MSDVMAAERPVFKWLGRGVGIPDDLEKGEWFEDPDGKLRKAYDDMPMGWIPWLDPEDIGAFREDPFPGDTTSAGVVRVYVNPTGITPTEFKVLIEPKAVEEVTKGGIIIPDATKDSEKYAQTEGRIIARSPLAFSYATEAEWEANKARKPDAGDLVLYAKYAGVRVKGRDGKEYLLINDKDVTATIEE